MEEKKTLHSPFKDDLTHLIDFQLQSALARASGFFETTVKSNLEEFDAFGSFMTAMECAVGGRLIIRATGTQIKVISHPENPVARQTKPVAEFKTNDLYALGDNTPGCQNVLRALCQHPEDALKVIEIFKKHGLRNGAFWCIYSDLANRDIKKFIELVVSENKRAIEHGKYYSDE